MAATTELQKPDAQHYVDYEEFVDFQLEKTRSSIKLTDIFTTLTTLAVVVITYLLAFVVFDQWVLEGGFGYAARVAQLSVLMAVILGTLAWRVILPLMRRVHPLYAARIIEKSDPNLKSNLVNFVDVRQSNMQSAPIVLKAMEKRAAVELSHIDVEEAVDRRPLLRIAYALLGVVVICALYILLSPKDPFASVRRALLPTAAIDVATETTISEVVPGNDMELPAGNDLVITADVRGKDADSAQIQYTTADHKYVNQSVEMKRVEPALPRFSGVLNGENGRGLLQSLKYRIIAGDARTRDFAITVVQSASARVEEVQYEYPTYMELENRTTAEGHIDGWEGSSVSVHAIANMPVKSARIVLTDVEDARARGEEITMRVTDGTKLSATWKLEFRSDGTAAHFYHIDVRTENNTSAGDPTHYAYSIRADRPPEVALLAPTSDLGMPPDAAPVPANTIIPLIIHAADPDFKLRSIALKAERKGETILDQKLFEDQLPAPACQGNFDFPLAPLKLNEGDTIQFWIEARDNKQPTANRGTTPRINVRVGKPVSPKEAQQQLAEEKRKQDQLAQTEGQQNPPRPDNLPPPKPGADGNPEKPQPRNERMKPEDRQKPVNEGAEKDPNNAPGKSDQTKEGGVRKRPATEQEALQRFAQEENRNKTGDNSQEQKESEDETNSAERNTSPANRDERGTAEEKRPGAAPKNAKQADNANQAGNDREKPSDNGPDNGKPRPGDRPKEKPQGSDANSRTKTDQSKTEKKDKQRQDQAGRNDNDQQRSKSDDADQDRAGGHGKADERNPGGKTDGDQAGTSPKTQPKKDQAKNGVDNSDKPGDVKKPGTGKQPGKDGSNGGEANTSKNDGTDKGKTGKREAGEGDPAKNDPNTNDSKKPDDSGTGARSGKNGKEPEKAGNQPDGKDDPSKAGKSGADSKPSDGDDEPAAADPKKKSPGGDGKPDEKPDSGSRSQDPSAPKGTAGESDNEQEDQQPGRGTGKPSKKSVDDPAKPGQKDSSTGEETPADPLKDSVKKRATGDETGKGVGDDEDDPQAPKAKNDIQRKEGTKSGKKKTSPGSPAPNAKKGDGERQPEDGTAGSSPDPEHVKRPGDTKDDADRTGKVDDEDTNRVPNDRKRNQGDQRPDKPPRTANEDLKGPGRPRGQKSQQPQGGEEGSSSPNEDGKRGANQTGPGDKTDEPGETDPSSKPTGESGKQKGPGSKTRPTDQEGQPDSSPGNESGKQSSPKSGPGKSDKKSGQSGEPGKPGDNPNQVGNEKANGPRGKSGEGQTGDKPAENGDKPGAGQNPGSKSPTGKPSGQSGQPGKPGSNTGSAKSGGGVTGVPGEGDGKAEGSGGPSEREPQKPRDAADDDEPPTPEQEEADLEYARKATNLVLSRLKDQLRRGDVDQKLLDELGWNDQKDLERFAKFLEQGLNARDDDTSPEAVNRRQQFEETLKSLRLGNETGIRTGSAGNSRQTRQNAVRNIPVPPEVRKFYESYTRSVSKNPDPSADKPNPGKAKKPSR